MAAANETPTYVLCARWLAGVPLRPVVVPGPSIDLGQSLVGFVIRGRTLQDGSLKGGDRLTDGTSTRVLWLVVLVVGGRPEIFINHSRELSDPVARFAAGAGGTLRAEVAEPFKVRFCLTNRGSAALLM